MVKDKNIYSEFLSYPVLLAGLIPLVLWFFSIEYQMIPVRKFVANNPGLYLWMVLLLGILAFAVERRKKLRFLLVLSTLLGIVTYKEFFDSFLPY